VLRDVAEYALATIERDDRHALAERIDGDALIDRPHGAMTSGYPYPGKPP
jgi:hypothetical protein